MNSESTEKKNTMQKPKTHKSLAALILAIILIVSCLYWFGYRPYSINTSCHEDTVNRMRYNDGTAAPATTQNSITYTALFEACKHRSGL